MIKNYILLISLLFSCILQAEDTVIAKQPNNKSLLGNTYVMAYIGTTRFGDEDTANLNDNVQFGVSGSFKMTENISISLSVETLTVDIDYNGISGDSSETTISLGALYHFLPYDAIDPYITFDFVRVSTKENVKGLGYTSNTDILEIGYALSAGAEFDLSDTVFLTPAASYSYVGIGYASKDLSIKMEIELNKNVYISGKIFMDLDETDTGYFVGIAGKY